MKSYKKTVKLGLIIILVCLLVSLTSCSFMQGNSGTTNNQYSVGLNLNGGEGVAPKDFISGQNLVKPDNIPTKDGCEFLGWYVDSDFKTEPTFNTAITADIVIYAKWSDPKWTISFVYGGSIEDDTIKVDNKGKATVPTVIPENPGYAIVGWYKNTALTEAFNFDMEITADTKIYAKWDIADYMISYDFDDGTPHVNTIYGYTVNSTVTLYSPSREGFEFLGWYDNAEFNGEVITSISKGSFGNKSFYAKYLGIGNTIESTLLGATIEDNTILFIVQHNVSSLELTASNFIVSERATWKLYDGETEITNKTISDLPDAPDSKFAVPPYSSATRSIKVTSEKGEIKTYAVTVRRYAEGATITVSFDTDGAAAIGNQTIPISTKATEPAIPSKSGYSFEGWFRDDDVFENEFNFNEAISENLTLYAYLKPIQYSINYVKSIGANNSTNPTTYNVESNITLLNGANTDAYTFVGWYEDKALTTAITTINGRTGNLTLYAKYHLTADTSAFASTYTEEQTFTNATDLAKYMDYLILHKITTWTFTLNVTDIGTTISNAQNKISVPKDNLLLPTSFSSTSSNLVTIEGVQYLNYPSQRAAESNMFTQYEYLTHEEYTAVRNASFDDFAINSIQETANVSTSEMLFYAATQGYRPIPAIDSAAERIYNKAKTVLRNIVDDSMTDAEKLHAIYDWIILNVCYDEALLIKSSTETEVHKYNGFFLEGVFDDKRAVCDGISKAFALLARIEGIEAVQVIFTPGNGDAGHAWNKVRVNGNWYIIDATSGGTLTNTTTDANHNITGGYEILMHKFFMITDAEMLERGGYAGSDHTDKVANTAYNVFGDISFTQNLSEYDSIITNQSELNIAIAYFKKLYNENTGSLFTIDLYINFDYGTEITDEITTAGTANVFSSFSYICEDDVLVIIAKRT